MVQAAASQPGVGLEQAAGQQPSAQQTAGHHQIGVQQQITGKGVVGSEPSAAKGDKQTSQILQGSSSVAGAGGVQAENSVIAMTGPGTTDSFQRTVTAKICRRCGVKGHLMSECTVTVFCEICKSTDHTSSAVGWSGS